MFDSNDLLLVTGKHSISLTHIDSYTAALAYFEYCSLKSNATLPMSLLDVLRPSSRSSFSTFFLH